MVYNFKEELNDVLNWKKILIIFFLGKFEIIIWLYKGDVCCEGLGSVCVDDSKLLIGFCLIVYLFKYKKELKNWKNCCLLGKVVGNKFCIILGVMEICILKIY